MLEYQEKRGLDNYVIIIQAERDGKDIVIEAILDGTKKVEGTRIRLAAETIRRWAKELSGKSGEHSKG